MRDRDKTLGIALVVLGGLFLLWQVTGRGDFAWPLFVIVPGLILLGAAFLGRREMASLAVPGSIVTTIGLILLILNAANRMDAWAYSWALIVAGAGAGNLIFGALQNDHAREREGLRTVYVGLTLFAVFGVLFEFIIWGGLGGAMRWLLPLLLIGFGVYLLFFRDPQAPLPWATRRAPGAPTPPPSAGPGPGLPPGTATGTPPEPTTSTPPEPTTGTAPEPTTGAPPGAITSTPPGTTTVTPPGTETGTASDRTATEQAAPDRAGPAEAPGRTDTEHAGTEEADAEQTDPDRDDRA